MAVNIDSSTMSESVKNLAKAQLKVQEEIKDIGKDSKGYGYNYTSFDSLVQYLRPLLAKNGISFAQMPVGDENQVGVQTIYMHTDSGEWITSVIKSPIAEAKGMNTYQSIGSAITYFRRYSLSAFVGIASDEDIDASQPEKEPDRLTKEQINEVSKLASSTNNKDLYLKVCNQIDDNTINANNYKAVIAKLKRTVKKGTDK